MNVPSGRRYRVWGPLTVVAVGGGLLLAQVGWLSGAALARLGATWPVFVILGGISRLLRRYMAPRPAAFALTGAFVVLCGGATLYAALGPDLGGGTATVSGSEPRGPVDSASLMVNAPAVTLDVNVGDTGSDLFRAQVTGDSDSRPAIDMDRGSATVTITSRTDAWWQLQSSRTTTVTVTLSREARWGVTINGAAVGGRVDLRGAARSVQVNSAAGDPALVLSAPRSSVPIKLNGASVDATIRVSTGVPCSVTTSGLAASITVDGHDVSGLGNQTWRDPAFASARDRYDISANGAAAHVRLVHE